MQLRQSRAQLRGLLDLPVRAAICRATMPASGTPGWSRKAPISASDSPKRRSAWIWWSRAMSSRPYSR